MDARAVISLESILRDHRRFRATAAEMCELAHHLTGQPGPAAFRALDRVITELGGPLLAHLEAEETHVYPRVAWEAGSPETVEALLEDHREIRFWVAALVTTRRGLEDADLSERACVSELLSLLGALVPRHLLAEELLDLSMLVCEPGDH